MPAWRAMANVERGAAETKVISSDCPTAHRHRQIQIETLSSDPNLSPVIGQRRQHFGADPLTGSQHTDAAPTPDLP